MTPLADLIVLYLILLQNTITAIQTLLWTRSIGLRVFRLTPAYAASTRTLAANQGVYNAFLALGLMWGILHVDQDVAAREIKTFFAGCVGIAGVFGGVTVGRKVLLVQGLPGVVAVGLLLKGF